MLPTVITRAAASQRASAVAFSQPSTPTSTAATLATQCLSRPKPNHQRRHSSSKAAPPADSEKPTTATKASPAAATTPSPHQETRTRAKRTNRYNRVVAGPSEKSKPQKSERFADLPAVPAIQHLHEKDFGLSSFFSLHRPLSLTTGVPPPTSTEHFNSLFARADSKNDVWAQGNSAQRRPEDVIYTLHNTIDALENGVNEAQEEGLRWEVINEPLNNSNAVKHLDGPARVKTLKELVDQFRPFHAPPPPEAFSPERRLGEQKKISRSSKQTQAPRQKQYTTTIVVTESTDARGQRTFTASSSPIVRVPDIEEQVNPTAVQDPSRSGQRVRQPFLERMQRRHRIYTWSQRKASSARPTARPNTQRLPGQRKMKIYLISVKRQRKLKMKKHKYKKLMKRTRNLRRRLDRA